MTEREKVIKGLECLSTLMVVHDCEHCPYRHNPEYEDGCVSIQQLMREALDILKKLEPKVLTPDEIKYLGDYYPIWLESTIEEIETRPAIYQPDNSDKEFACIVSVWCKSGFYDWNNYKRDWRCWSARPTREQMEETPWNIE